MSLHIDDEDRYWHTQEEHEDRGWWRFASPLRYVLYLLSAILLVIGIWYLFFDSPHHHSQSVPLIRADKSPYKIPSDDKSVASVQNQDKLVYERLQASLASDHIEHILPEPEPIVELPAPAQLDTEERADANIKMVPQYPDVENISESVAFKLEDFPVETSLMAEEESLSIEEDDPISSLIAQTTREESETEITKISAKEDIKEESESQTAGTVQIQLGSLKSKDEAEAEWKRLSKKHAEILGQKKHTVQKVDLGAEKGIFYRLRAVGFKSKEKAKAACKAINDQKGSCSVVSS